MVLQTVETRAILRGGRESMLSNYSQEIDGVIHREEIPRLLLSDITPIDRTRMLMVKNKKKIVWSK